jgi:integrase
VTAVPLAQSLCLLRQPKDGCPHAPHQQSGGLDTGAAAVRLPAIGHWHAHEGRHTAVSIMSSNGVPIQEISDTVGHKSTHVTETVYRHVIVPAIRGGATVMDDVFGDPDENE